MRSIHVNQLSQHFITRKRGLEAYKKLYRHLNLGPIVLNLNDVDMISYSFLDEIILMASKTSKLDKIVFCANSNALTDKLARISGVRNYHINIVTSNNNSTKIRPKNFSCRQAIFADSK